MCAALAFGTRAQAADAAYASGIASLHDKHNQLLTTASQQNQQHNSLAPVGKTAHLHVPGSFSGCKIVRNSEDLKQ